MYNKKRISLFITTRREIKLLLQDQNKKYKEYRIKKKTKITKISLSLPLNTNKPTMVFFI